MTHTLLPALVDQDGHAVMEQKQQNAVSTLSIAMIIACSSLIVTAQKISIVMSFVYRMRRNVNFGGAVAVFFAVLTQHHDTTIAWKVTQSETQATVMPLSKCELIV